MMNIENKLSKFNSNLNHLKEDAYAIVDEATDEVFNTDPEIQSIIWDYYDGEISGLSVIVSTSKYRELDSFYSFKCEEEDLYYVDMTKRRENYLQLEETILPLRMVPEEVLNFIECRKIDDEGQFEIKIDRK